MRSKLTTFGTAAAYWNRGPGYTGKPTSFALAFLLAINPMLSPSDLFASESFLSCAPAGIAAAANISPIAIAGTTRPHHPKPVSLLPERDRRALIVASSLRQW